MVTLEYHMKRSLNIVQTDKWQRKFIRKWKEKKNDCILKELQQTSTQKIEKRTEMTTRCWARKKKLNLVHWLIDPQTEFACIKSIARSLARPPQNKRQKITTTTTNTNERRFFLCYFVKIAINIVWNFAIILLTAILAKFQTKENKLTLFVCII